MNTVAPSNAQLADQIATLTRELASLDRTRDDHVLELGRKLIPIRQLLQMTNGRHRGCPGPDGLSPRGWYDWCSAAGIGITTVHNAVRRAVNPEGHRQKVSGVSREKRRRSTNVIRTIRRAWPNWTNEDRAKVIATVRELAQESNRGA